jgi:hypothetical protein
MSHWQDLPSRADRFFDAGFTYENAWDVVVGNNR